MSHQPNRAKKYIETLPVALLRTQQIEQPTKSVKNGFESIGCVLLNSEP